MIHGKYYYYNHLHKIFGVATIAAYYYYCYATAADSADVATKLIIILFTNEPVPRKGSFCPASLDSASGLMVINEIPIKIEATCTEIIISPATVSLLSFLF